LGATGPTEGDKHATHILSLVLVVYYYLSLLLSSFHDVFLDIF
jgi:hypothetical protein